MFDPLTMNPRDKAAGKRIVGSSSNWSCSLPPVSSFSTPFSTLYPAGSSHFSPGPSPVMTESSSQVFSLPFNASPMSSPPRNPSLSPFPDSLTTWSPYPYMSFTDLLNHGQDLFTSSANENALVFSSGPPPLMMTQPSSQAHSLPLSTSPTFPPSSSASIADLLNLLLSPNWSFQDNVPLISSFSPEPPAMTTQPSSQVSSSFPVSFSTWSTSPTVSFSDSLNHLPSPNWNLQGHVSFTNPVNRTENSLNLTPYASQAPSPNWNHHGNVPSSFQSPNDPNTPYGLNHISTSSKHAGVVSDPKKVQRILKNRESAARSWEKKQRYVNDLLDKIKFLEEAYDSSSSKISILEEENKMLRKAPKQNKNQKQTKDQETQVSDEDLIEHLVADAEMHNNDEFNEQETSLECVSQSSQGN